jgi:hypothetical protein
MSSPLCFITAVQRLGKFCIPVRTPPLLMCLISRVTSLDTSSMLLKRFPWSGSPPAVQSWHEPTRIWLVPKIEETYVGQLFTKYFRGKSSWNQLSGICNTNGNTQENLPQYFTQRNRTLGKPKYKWEDSRLLREILYKQNTNCRNIKTATNCMALSRQWISQPFQYYQHF